MEKKIIKFDVMLDGYFVHTFRMEVHPVIPPSDKEIYNYVVERLPTLKGKDFKVYIYENENK